MLSIRVKRQMQTGLIIKQREAVLQIIKWHRKGTFNFTKIVNNHQPICKRNVETIFFITGSKVTEVSHALKSQASKPSKKKR